MTTRRSLLLGTAAVALSACSGSATTPAQVITDIENLGGALTNDLALLGPTLGIPAATITTIKTVVADIVSVGNNVASGILSGGPGVQAVFTDIEAIVSAVTPFASLIPGPWTLALAAAQVLLPVLASLVGTALPASAAEGPKAAFKASLPGMTIAEAEATLAAQAKR